MDIINTQIYVPTAGTWNNQHIAAVKNRQTQESAIAEHLIDAKTGHWIEIHDPKVLSTECHYYARMVRDALENKKHRYIFQLRRDDHDVNNRKLTSLQLSASRNPLINKCVHSALSLEKPGDMVSLVCSVSHRAIFEAQMRVDGDFLSFHNENMAGIRTFISPT